MNIEHKNIVNNVLVILENSTKDKIVPSSKSIIKLNDLYNKNINTLINGEMTNKQICKFKELVEKVEESLVVVSADNYKYVNSCMLSSKRFFVDAKNIFKKGDMDLEDFDFCVNVIFQGLEHLVLASLINEGKFGKANDYRRSMDSSVKNELTNMVHNFLINY